MQSTVRNDSRTILLVGCGGSSGELLREALFQQGVAARSISSELDPGDVLASAPDLIVLAGEAAACGGERALHVLAQSPGTAVLAVALLAEHDDSEQRLSAFRNGAVAVVLRQASIDATAQRLAELARDMFPRRFPTTAPPPELDRKPASGPSEAEPVGIAADVVDRVRALVSDAETISFDKSAAAAARLLFPGGVDGPLEELEVFRGLRIMLALRDSQSAQVLARALREHGATVVTTDAGVQDLEIVRSLDPSVVILDAETIAGAGDVIPRLRKDPRLQWTPALGLLPRDVVGESGSPNLAALARLVSPVVEQDRALGRRAALEPRFDTRLEETGPFRLVRALAAAEPMLHATVCSSRLVAEVDTVCGLVVAASATPPGLKRHVEGIGALAELLRLEEGRVRVERRPNPATVNIMLPTEEALSSAALELSAPTSAMPDVDRRPSLAAEASRAVRGAPGRSLFDRTEAGQDDDDTDAIRTTVLRRPGPERSDEAPPVPAPPALPEPILLPAMAPGNGRRVRVAAVLAATCAAGLVVAFRVWGESPRAHRPLVAAASTVRELDEPTGKEPLAAWSVPPEPARVSEEPRPQSVPSPADRPTASPSRRGSSDRRLREILAGAMEMSRERRWADAERIYLEALSLRPDSFVATVGLARIHLQRGDATSAVLWAKRSAGIRPSSPGAQVLLGDAQALAGDRASAQESWRQALRANPNDAAARQRLELRTDP